MKPNNRHISKYLSLVLRHQPDSIGITLDENGWASVTILLEKLQQKFKYMTLEILEDVVKTNDKQRFAFNNDNTKIRANQGHSVNIDLGYSQQEPPELLYHGTVSKFISNIKEQGLLKMNRHHVHLSEDLDTATKVGSRRGQPILLSINSGHMHKDGHVFYQSNNGVWLTNHVPAEYIEFK